jgi:hypothetical protein
MHKLALNVCFFGKPDMLVVMDAVIGKDLRYEECKILSTVHSYRLAAICAENKIDAIIAYSFGDNVAEELDLVTKVLPPIIFVQGKVADKVPERVVTIVDTTVAHTGGIRAVLVNILKSDKSKKHYMPSLSG